MKRFKWGIKPELTSGWSGLIFTLVIDEIELLSAEKLYTQILILIYTYHIKQLETLENYRKDSSKNFSQSNETQVTKPIQYNP